jgi:hypothetical protein
MNYSACWRSKKALVSIICHTFTTRANRVVIVCSIIATIFNLCKCWAVTFQPFQMTLMIYHVFVNNAHCQLLLFNIVWFIVHFLFDFCSIFMQCFLLWDYFVWFDFIVQFHVHPVKMQSWSWIVFQVIRFHWTSSSSKSINIIQQTAPSLY